MKLTKTQIDILDHRLSSGCVADCLADTEELGISLTDAECAVEKIKRMVKEGEIPLESLTPTELEVVIDCLDGSTYFANADDAVTLHETTRGAVLEAHKAATRLEAEISKAAGRRVLCVRY